ncbi:MAG: hypothetical protein LBH86_03465 [Oscillospiraceae bacterium]|jgi:putative membrane fusion protein|nr:hypothetical protein [Oscillospiraceae bacterium]
MKKQGVWVTRFVFLLLFVFVVAFMGYHVIDAFNDPVGTVNAVLYTVEETLETDGVFVRDERALPLADGIVETRVAEGARVARGETLAVAYRDPSVQGTFEELRRLSERIEQLAYIRRRAVDITNPSALDETIRDSVLAIIGAVDNGDLRDLRGQDMEMRSLLYKRDYTFGGGEDLDVLIERLEEEYQTKRRAADWDVTPVTADSPGTFSRVVDGYEAVLTPAALDEMTAEDVTAFLARPPAADSGAYLGKLIFGFAWQYAAVIPEAESRSFTPGAQVEMRVGSDEYRAQARVKRVEPAADGTCLLVLESDRDMINFADLRRQSVRILRESYTGIRIPRGSTRMDEEKGPGVYCRVLNQARFKKIEILLERGNYYLVTYTPEESDALLPGDEIIVRAKDLFDGKVLS